MLSSKKWWPDWHFLALRGVSWRFIAFPRCHRFIFAPPLDNFSGLRLQSMSLATSPAIERLASASACLDELETLLKKPIQSVLSPPRTVPMYRRGEGIVDVPGPSQRAAAEAYSSLLSDVVNDVERTLLQARFAVRYRVLSFSCWGDLPPVVLFKPLDADFPNALLLAHNRWKQLRSKVRNRQARLIARLEIKDPMKGLAHAER